MTLYIGLYTMSDDHVITQNSLFLIDLFIINILLNIQYLG